MAVSRAAAFLFGTLLLCPCVAAPAPVEPPRLIVEAPPALAATAVRLRATSLASAMGLVGLARPGPPIRVIVAPEGSGPAALVPPWISGYALSDRGLVV